MNIRVFVSCPTNEISCLLGFISKEIRQAEHEYMNIQPPINPLISSLVSYKSSYIEHCLEQK